MSDVTLPNALYKYYPPTSWDYIFKKKTIRFTPAAELNDPFECRPLIKATRDRKELHNSLLDMQYHYNKYILKIHHEKYKNYFCPILFINNKKIIEMICDSYFENIDDSDLNLQMYIRHMLSHIFGIFCLSENNTNLLMWSHYAKSHSGFSVEFNMNYSFFNSIDKFKIFIPQKIIYSSDRSSNQFNEIKDLLTEFFKKSEDWSYEKEWRIIAFFHNKETSAADPQMGIHPLPRSAISSIVFGANMPEEDIAQKISEIQSQPDCSHIKLQKARLHPSRYELIIENMDSEEFKKSNQKEQRFTQIIKEIF